MRVKLDDDKCQNGESIVEEEIKRPVQRGQVISIASGSTGEGDIGDTEDATGTPTVPLSGRIARFLESSLDENEEGTQ